RIYDPRRAEVYQRLGIPTVATVRWTADQMLRRLLPEGAEALWRDPARQGGVAGGGPDPARVGGKGRGGEAAAGGPGALSPRLGEAMLPGPGVVLQEGDVLHVMAVQDGLPDLQAALGTRDGPGRRVPEKRAHDKRAKEGR